MKLFESDGVHPNSLEIIQTLVDKHPAALQPHVPVPSPLFVQFEIETVPKCIESFPGGSAGVVFSMNECHLKSIVRDPQLGPEVLRSLASYCSLFVTERFPSEVAPFYAGAI